MAVCLVAGTVRSDEPGWQPSTRPAGVSVPVPVLPPAPAPVPAAAPRPTRSGDGPKWESTTRPDGPVWLPATPKLAIPLPDRTANVVQESAPPKTLPESLPAPRIPDVPEKAAADSVPTLPPPRPVPESDVPASRPTPPANVWAGGQPVDLGHDLEPLPDLPRAHMPVPVRHRTFGSPNITLSRDYHFLDMFGIDLSADEGGTVVLAERPPPTDRYFVQAEYLLWWVNRANVPSLATTGVGSSLGFLGQPGTVGLLGPGGFGSTARNGFRVRGGAWFDNCGIDGSFFFLGRQTSSAQFSSLPFPTLTRPFFAPNIGQEFGELVAFPGLATGTLRAETSSYLWGADLNFRQCICRTCDMRSEWFAGYRHLNLRESLSITEAIISGPTSPDPIGTQIFVNDTFRTQNQFHGGQVGYGFGRRWGRFVIDGRASVALGVTHQNLDIEGGQVRQRPGQAPSIFTGGLLAAGPNIGSFDRNKFSVVPEATFNVGYMVTPTLRAYVGYNFLYWTNVIRPGDQIDRVIDLSFVPNSPTNVPASGLLRPQPTFHQSDLVVQGVQFGMELRW
jgi:hypothetical protein